MQEATESSLGYDLAPEPNLKDLQSHGYAEVYARHNGEHFKHDPFVFVPPTIEEMEAAFRSGANDENGFLCVRGLTYEVDLASADLLYRPTVFRPDTNGEVFYVEPVYEDGRIIDLIWSTPDLDDWGFTTGRGAVLGAENLSKTYTAKLPLHVYNHLHRYWEHFQECEDGSDNEDAVCILKQSARALLPAVGHVQVFYWDDVEDLAEGFFAECPERVSAFQDREAFDAFVKRAALWERFDDMQAPTPPAGPRLTWADAKVAIKDRRKTNAETGLDGFEEFRARVKAHAARPEVSAAIDAFHDNPSDENKLLAQDACMPFYLMDVIIGRIKPIVSFKERKRRREKAATATDGEPIVVLAEPVRDPMFQRIGKLKARSRQWLIRGLIARNEVGNPFGRPDSFKGVSGAQLCVHIAGGVEFLGLEVKQAPTAYFAAERGEQVKIRIKGHIQRLGLPEDLPCYFGDRPINLLDDKDVQFLLEEIKMMERDAGQPLGFLVIDTQSRTLDGDENTTKDGAKYAKAIETIRKKTSASLWVISHTGHAEDAQDRPRGNSSLLGAYDTFYRHTKKDETHGSIKITLDRDGLGQRVFHFAVNLHDTGLTNEDGEPVMVPYIEPDVPPVDFKFGKPGNRAPKAVTPTDTEREALRALEKAIKEHGLVTLEGEGRPTPDGESIPPGEVTVSAGEWKAAFHKLDRKRERTASSHAFTRASNGLVAKKLVGTWSDRRWPT